MSGPSSELQLHFHCADLPRKDLLSKSDPFIVMYLYDKGSDQYFEYGRTETIQNNHNPHFQVKLNIQYFFEVAQRLKFEVYDEDEQGGPLSHQDYLGEVEVTLGRIMGEYHGTFTQVLNDRTGKRSRGSITVIAEETTKSSGVVQFNIRATNVDKKDFFGKSDPFLVISREVHGAWTPVYTTKELRNTLNPVWPPFEVDLTTLCNANPEISLKFEVLDWNRVGDADFIGAFETTLSQLQADPATPRPLINPAKQAKKKGYKNSGELHFDQCVTEYRPSFIEYLMGGLQLSCSFAVDFTASNGRKEDPNSLHFISPHRPNAYAIAIEAVGNIIQDYDSDKLFPAFGFGCRLPSGEVTFQLPLNGNPQNPYCAGVSGVLQAYYSTLPVVELWGPTNFAPIINISARSAHIVRAGHVDWPSKTNQKKNWKFLLPYSTLQREKLNNPTVPPFIHTFLIFPRVDFHV
eukprot:m.125628 g.125628  ORF g.125628 m.125628 type:complete len:462 (-) comp15625_c0_seq7:532-1917(-)